MKNKMTTILMIIALLIGVSLLLYPTISDHWNAYHQSYVMAGYDETVKSVSAEERERIWNEAVEYNKALSGVLTDYTISADLQLQYDEYLNIGGDGMMGYIEIPSIDCRLPIFHGTDEKILQVAIGHLEWSSLPVGGIGSHCVLSGHRGLPSAKLFSDLDKLNTGDVFVLRVLNETLTYEVDQIRIVEPSDTSELHIVDGQDYCTLVTCTPYGINTHRLLVRGHRIENAREAKNAVVVADATQVDPKIAALFVAVPILIVLLILVGKSDYEEEKEERKDREEQEKQNTK